MLNYWRISYLTIDSKLLIQRVLDQYSDFSKKMYLKLISERLTSNKSVQQ